MGPIFGGVGIFLEKDPFIEPLCGGISTKPVKDGALQLLMKKYIVNSVSLQINWVLLWINNMMIFVTYR